MWYFAITCDLLDFTCGDLQDLVKFVCRTSLKPLSMGFRKPLVRKMPVFYANMELKLTDMGLVDVN